MSTQRGNAHKGRTQKHQNVSTYKNNKYDTSARTKHINNLDIANVCARCKDILEWKIKYKKYKLLSVPRKCVKCEKKTIINAYHTVCNSCAKQANVCAKCGKSSSDIILPKPSTEELERQERELEQEIKSLSERKRRTLLRNVAKGKTDIQEELAAIRAQNQQESDSEDYSSDLERSLHDLSLDESSESDFEESQHD